MKLGRCRSLRGSFEVTGSSHKQQLIVDDGLINNGLKIISFNVWTDTGSGVGGIDCNLSLAPMPAHAHYMDASDNRQIAWVCGGFDNGTPISIPMQSFIDPNHVVNRDLYIHAFASVGLWNYLIIFEEYDLTDDEAIVQIIKETSQNTTP